VAKYRYWTNVLYDNSGAALPTPDPSVIGMSPTRSSSDTLARHIWVWKLQTYFDVGASGAPVHWWPNDATVYNDVVFDIDGSGPVGDIADDDPRRIGLDLLKVHRYTSVSTVPGSQAAYWETSVGILDLDTGRKGGGGEVVPTVWSRLWPVDHLGVFVGSYGSHVHFQVYGYGRALWLSDVPPSP
jgi:hypothetical protein